MATKEKAKEAPTGLTLADIAKDKQTIEEFLLENEGEVDPTIEALMQDNDLAAEQKITRVAAYIRDEEAFAEAIRGRAAGYVARARAIENRTEWFKNGYVARLLVQLGRTLGGERIADDAAVVRIQLNNPKLSRAMTDDEAKELFDFEEQMQAEYVADHEEWAAVFENPAPRPVPPVRHVEKVITTSYVVDGAGLLRSAKNGTLPPLPEGVSVVRDASVRLA